MATISGTTEEKIYQIKAWSGLNENPDGDTKLAMGEAAAMRNFRITRDGNLQRRPGSSAVLDMIGDDNPDTREVAGLWVGNIKGFEMMIGILWNKVMRLRAHPSFPFEKRVIGTINRGKDIRVINMFGYEDKLYIMSGAEYYQWDGSNPVKTVDGYRPLVLVTMDPLTGAGTLLEEVNKLTGARRGWYSSRENARSFKIAEPDIVSVDYVKDLTTGESVPFQWSVKSDSALVTLETAPSNGANTLEIGWTVKENDRARVLAMRFSETFNGATDNRVFLYGDGSNQAIYSGLDYDGNPRADYFPDTNVLVVGTKNEGITSMIRHYSRLIVYKEDSTYSCQYGVVTLDDNTTKAAFYVTPVNRSIGNTAPGQVRLVNNAPLSLYENSIYEWRNNSSYSSNLSVDERQAKRISNRVSTTLAMMNLKGCYTWNDTNNQEYYVFHPDLKHVLVYNYGVDAWYYYNGLKITCMASYGGKIYYGNMDGKLCEFDYSHRTDFGEPIQCYWESGSMDFGRDYMRKYSAMLWVGIKPEEYGTVSVTVRTDKKSIYAQKLVGFSLASLSRVDFSRWSFSTNRMPRMARLKIKAKKFVFYKLIFEVNEPDTNATILSADFRVRYTGYAR